jgi:tetratricopeptide (TPR) repeat protein
MVALRFLGVMAAALAGAFVGILVAWPYHTTTRIDGAFPLPHHVPKYPGGVSLRFAMVHDVLHERYPRHGRAYYEERNRTVLAALNGAAAKRLPDALPSAGDFALMDDLGVGLEMLGRHEEAVDLLRDKLRKQENAGVSGGELYTTYADLGTFLVHWQMAEGFADPPKAKERLREGLGFIRKSIEMKPDAHFGREIWQAVLLEFLLAALDKPDLLLQYDMIGDRLDKSVDPSQEDRINKVDPHLWGGAGMDREAAYYLSDAQRTPENAKAWENRVSVFRRAITTVGSEEGWKESVPTSVKQPVPFDEPTLGIIGMWRLGGGSNPHFALALGEIMMRVGQRAIAWCAYERAADLAPTGSKDAEIVRKLVAHSRKRQAVIEGQLPAEEAAALRPRYTIELAFGRRYQEEYQTYEARRIAQGESLDDPHFYDAFDAEHGPIASPVGPEDRYVVEQEYFPNPRFFPTLALFAGVFAFSAACLLRWLSGRRLAHRLG